MKKILLVIIMASLFSACGSRPSDFNTGVDVQNPLPPCPDSPNCVRISQQYPLAIDAVWENTLSVLQEMKPYDIELSPDEYRINSVFLVVFFRDDMAIQLEEKDSTATYLHIRSSSRVGYGDMGVNRRRVKDFLERMEKVENPKTKD